MFSLFVSIGEGVDKLTILDIKQTFIKDENKLLEVRKEYNTLIKSLEYYIEKCKRHYLLLKHINLTIWNLEDEIRTQLSDDRCSKVAKSIVYENDSRFRVKDKINKFCSSELKEQKGYLVKTIYKILIDNNNIDNNIDNILEKSVRNDRVIVNFSNNVNEETKNTILEYFKYDNMITFMVSKKPEAFLLSHLGLGDNILCLSMVNYLSNYYDKVWFVCKDKYKDNINLLLNNDKVSLYIVKDDKDISPFYGYNFEKFLNETEHFDIYLCGTHNFYNPNVNNFPLGFYDDINIDRKVFWDYFYVNKPRESLELYNEIKDRDYIVIHNIASNGKIFDSKEIIKKYADSNLLIINFNENEYETSHENYDLAQKFILKPLAYYQDIIENAKYIFMTDSSLFCLSLQLPIKTQFCYYIPRTKEYNYELIYESKIFNYLKNKKFNRILL